MRNYIKILPFGLFIIAQSAYDNYAPMDNTNWSIFYFASQYFTFLLFSLILAKGTFIKKLPFYVMTLGFAYMVYRNVSKWNMKYDDFKVSVNDFEADLLFNLFMIVSLSIVLGKLYSLFGWVSQKLKKRGV